MSAPKTQRRKTSEEDSEFFEEAFRRHPWLLLPLLALLAFMLWHVGLSFLLLIDHASAVVSLISDRGISVFWEDPWEASRQIEASIDPERFALFLKLDRAKEAIEWALLIVPLLGLMLWEGASTLRSRRAGSKKRRG